MLRELRYAAAACLSKTFFASWTVGPPWKLKAARRVVPAGKPVFVNPASARVVVVGTGQLSKCWSCFQYPGVHPSPPVVVVVVVVDVVLVVSVVLVLVLPPANPTPARLPAAMNPLTASTEITNVCRIRCFRFFIASSPQRSKALVR
jgi:hypothetical protein